MKHFSLNQHTEINWLSYAPEFQCLQTTPGGQRTQPNPEDRRKEELALNLHRKNRKKYTHLYELEKYFK
jgi:hypothetical protein